MIGLYKGKSPVNRLAQKFNRSPYGHASWIFRDGRVGEAVGSGFRITESPFVGHLPGTVIDVYNVVLSPDQHDIIEDFILSLNGKPYDWAGLFGFVNLTSSESTGSREKWFCSEAVSAACMLAGRPLLNLLPYYTSPRDLSISPLINLKESLTITGERQAMNHNYTAAIEELKAVQYLKTIQLGELIARKTDGDTAMRVGFIKNQIKEIEMACRVLECPDKSMETEVSNG